MNNNTYFNNLNHYNTNEYLNNMEEYAHKNNVPIIQKEGLDVLLAVIKLHNVKKILEIGCAIGYSSVCFCMQDEEIQVYTIERDQKMYDLATNNIKNLGLDKRINIIFKDALDVDENSLDKDFDLIFIDAAKSQYIKFFEKFSSNLKKGGIIFSDNLLFHGLIEEEKGNESKNLKQMLKKIRNFNDYLSNNQDYDTSFLKVGDGIAISKKK